jgi:hypothetical protein
VGVVGDEVLLEEELQRVGQRVEEPPRADAENVGPVRSAAVLDVRRPLPLHPGHHDDQAEAEGEEDRDPRDRHRDIEEGAAHALVSCPNIPIES